MDENYLEDRVIEHLQEIGHAKRAILQVAVKISHDFPTDAELLLSVILGITRTADKLLGDTQVT